MAVYFIPRTPLDVTFSPIFFWFVAFSWQMFILVNNLNVHWYLLVVLVEDKVAKVWDPLPDNSAFARRLMQVRRLVSVSLLLV